MSDLTPESISVATRADLRNVTTNWPHILSALDWAGINTPLVQVGMAATIAIETGHFAPIAERRASAEKNPDIYNLQKRYWDTGFYGRGYIQLTWEYNYSLAGKALGINLVKSPELVMESEVSAKIAAWFFKEKSVDIACQSKDWHTVRRLVNGSGYANSVESFKRFLRICTALENAI